MQPLSQVLSLLAAAVLLVTLARRLGLATTIAYLLVGLALGPHALAVVDSTATTRLLAELGVVFLLFTLGLEFALPRLIAMRREVFGLGCAQVARDRGGLRRCWRGFGGIAWPAAVVVGGALAMSSTAILLHQLTERAELNRTHGRLAFSMLLFQDLAFVPFLALASALTAGRGRFDLERRASRRWPAACSPSRRCWRPAAGCCGRSFTRWRTAGCGSSSRSPCCWWCWPRPGSRASPGCRRAWAPFSPA